MRGADRITGAALLALAVAFAVGALKSYAYWGENGPGPAFLPFWLGIVMAVLALLLLVGALLDVVGMIVGTAVFLIVLLRFLDRQSWPVTVGVALATAGFIFLVFIRWL